MIHEQDKLDAEVATVVMGWVLGTVRSGDGGDLYWFDDPASPPVIPVRLWQPSRSIASAWEVVHRMKILGWFFTFYGCPGRAEFMHTTKTAVCTDASEDSTPASICRAAIGALGLVAKKVSP